CRIGSLNGCKETSRWQNDPPQVLSVPGAACLAHASSAGQKRCLFSTFAATTADARRSHPNNARTHHKGHQGHRGTRLFLRVLRVICGLTSGFLPHNPLNTEGIQRPVSRVAISVAHSVSNLALSVRGRS